jgi:hypothetical protein
MKCCGGDDGIYMKIDKAARDSTDCDDCDRIFEDGEINCCKGCESVDMRLIEDCDGCEVVGERIGEKMGDCEDWDSCDGCEMMLRRNMAGWFVFC